VIILTGEGYSLMWPEGAEPRRYEWQSVDDRAAEHVVPPALQHGHAPARYLAFKHEATSIRNEQGVPKAWISRRLGGDQIDYADERPAIRQLFTEALARHDLKPRMDEAYRSGAGANFRPRRRDRLVAPLRIFRAQSAADGCLGKGFERQPEPGAHTVSK